MARRLARFPFLPRLLPLGPAPGVRLSLERRRRAPLPSSSPFYRGRSFPFVLFRQPDGTLLVRWARFGTFLISQRGRRIIAYPAAGLAASALRDLLITAIASFALLERRTESLHASAVTSSRQAVAFLGGPASGKSTLAAWFARRGWRLLTDDLLAVGRRGHQVVAYPALPEIKLSRAAARALGLSRGRVSRVEPGRRKRIWKTPEARGPRPLVALYFPRLVSPRGRLRLLPLSRRAAFRTLLACTYNATVGTRGRLRRQFALLTRLARLPARRLLVPRQWNKLGEVAERIELDLTGLARRKE